MAEQPDVIQDPSPDTATPDGEKPEPTNVPAEEPTGDTVPRSRLNEVIAERNALKEQVEAAKPKPDEKPQEEPPASPASLTAEDVLKLRNEGYSDSEVLTLVEQSRALNVPPSKLLENKLFKAGLESARETARAEDATPAPSHSSVKIGDKSISDMSPEEMSKDWNSVRDAYMGKGGKKTV